MRIGDRVRVNKSGMGYEVVAMTEDGRAIISDTTPNNILTGTQLIVTDAEVSVLHRKEIVQ